MRILLIGNSFIDNNILDQYLKNKHIFVVAPSELENNKILNLLDAFCAEIVIFNGEIDYKKTEKLLLDLKKYFPRVSIMLLTPKEKLQTLRDEGIEILIDDFVITPTEYIEFSMRIRKIIERNIKRDNKLNCRIEINHNLNSDKVIIQKEIEQEDFELNILNPEFMAEKIIQNVRTTQGAVKAALEKTSLNNIVQDSPRRFRKRTFKNLLKGPAFSKIADISGKIIFGIMLVITVIMAIFLVQNKISKGTPSIAGLQMYVVLSGSMSPAFDTGSLIFVKPIKPDNLKEGDIITFRGGSGSNSVVTTHRVIEINEENGLSFITKGDANNVQDPNPVLPDRVIGKVTGHVAYVGYIMEFAQTKQGLILLVFIPGMFIILYELKNIFKITQVEKSSKGEKNDKDKDKDDKDKARENNSKDDSAGEG